MYVCMYVYIYVCTYKKKIFLHITTGVETGVGGMQADGHGSLAG